MIRRCPRPTTGFYVISNEVSSDPRLSWPARGMLTYLLSKPDHWAVSVANLVNQTAEAVGVPSGRDAVYTVLRELMITRYIKRVQKRREDGTMAGVEYIVSEMPFAEERLGHDFLTKKQLAQRRSSLAAKKRSFAAVKESTDAPAPDSPSSETGQSSAPPGTTGPSSPPRDVEPPAANAAPLAGDAHATPAAQECTTTPANGFSPLPDHPEAVQPDTANTTQAKTDLKKERTGSKDPVARAARARSERKRRGTGKAPDIELFDASTLAAKGVDPKAAATWLVVRARKRAVNSMLALEGVEVEAAAAGLSLAQAIKTAAQNSWQGFRAAWVKPSDNTGRRPPRSGAQMTEEELVESIRKAKAELFGEGSAPGVTEPTLLDRDGDLWRAPV